MKLYYFQIPSNHAHIPNHSYIGKFALYTTYQNITDSRKTIWEVVYHYHASYSKLPLIRQYRGWGTELAPEHITQLYNKQIELWYQVSRRSSLSALSLASTNHK